MTRAIVPFAFAASIVLAGVARAKDNGHGDHGGHMHAPPAFAAGETGNGASVSRSIDVIAREADGKMSFEPSRVAIHKGETVAFTIHNAGQLDHEFVLGTAAENAAHAASMEAMPDMQHDEPNAVRIAPGHTERLVWHFGNPGTFEFACLIPGHYAAGMKGAAIVH